MNGEDQFDQQANILRLLQAAGYGEQPEAAPQMQPSPGLRLGPLRVGGGTLDNASASILQSMRGGMPRPRNAGEALGGGFLQGFAQARAGRAQARQQQFAGESEAVGKRNESRQKFLEKSIGEQEQERNIRTRPKTTQSLADIEAESAARARGSASVVRPVDPSLIASREALTSEREQRAADKEDQKAQRDQDASETALGIADFTLDPTAAMAGRDMALRVKTQNEVNRVLKERGSPYNLRQLQQLRKEADRISAVMTNPKNVAARNAALTVHDHLEQLDRFYTKYQEVAKTALSQPGVFSAVARMFPKELRDSNAAILWAAQNGILGPQAADDANALTSVGDPVRREAELVFSGGFAPFEAEISRGFKKLDEARGPEGFKGQMRALKGLLRKRIEMQSKSLPFFGGPNNPYLLDATPMGAWLSKEQEATEQGTDTETPEPIKTNTGGKAGKYGK